MDPWQYSIFIFTKKLVVWLQVWVKIKFF